MELNQVTLPAVDVAASVAFYRKMGFELIVKAPHYARFKSPVGNATFSVHAVDAMVEPPKTIVYFECSSLDQQVASLNRAGCTLRRIPAMSRGCGVKLGSLIRLGISFAFTTLARTA